MATKKEVSKFKFGTWRESEPFKGSCTGNPEKPEYMPFYDDNGYLKIKEIGKENVYDRIQSFASECDINMIIKRYQMGDVQALSKAQGIYIDASNTPENMADLLNKLNKAEAEFDKLPIEFKQKYGNDFIQFICQFDPRDLIAKVQENTLIDSQAVKEVKKDE